MPFFFFFKLAVSTSSSNCSQLHFLFPISSWTERQMLQFVCACWAANKLQSYELPAGALWLLGRGGQVGFLPSGLPLPINSPVFVTRCAARRWLSWHKERLCQICDMMLICVRCRGTHSLCSPLPATCPAPFFTERSLVFRSRDDNRDRRRRRDGEAPDGYITTEEETDLWGRRCRRLQHFNFCGFPANSGSFHGQANILMMLHQ